MLDDDEVAPQPKKKAVLKLVPKDAIFESSRPESHQFDVCGVRGVRDPSGMKVQWHVPANKVELFRQHHHVMTGRIVIKE